MAVAAANPAREREAIAEQRYEAYRAWEQREMRDPRFASTRMLVDDIGYFDEVREATWERFDIEELTWGAEILNAPHIHVDRFRFDGRDIIVKEADGVNPAVTLRGVYQGGLDKARADFAQDPRLAFQLRRDELFMEFYEAVERMMRGEIEADTIHMKSTCPSPHELPFEYDESVELLESKFYDLQNRKSFDYTARRLPDGRLELSATRIDSSDTAAHAAVLHASGFENVSFALLTSHEFGRFLAFENTTDRPIETVIAARVNVYDQAMETLTGQKHRFGRVDDKPDAHQFFREHVAEYWAGYKAFNELLARHLAGRELSPALQGYLLKCLSGQEEVGQSVLSAEKLVRLRTQLESGTVTMDMAMSCRELLIYDHHATLTKLYTQYCETGVVDQLAAQDGGGFMDAYADAASSNGSQAAANGDTFAGCETATGVNSIAPSSSMSAAAELAAMAGVSFEQALRMQEEEAAHCLRIQLYGYTIRRGVQCPFCAKKVDAKDTTATIECLDVECRTVLDKATGAVTSRRLIVVTENEDEGSEMSHHSAKPTNGTTYTIGGMQYRRNLVTVIGGAQLTYVNAYGELVKGPAAEELEAIIAGQLASAPQAA